jgi:glycerol-3-phosphate dehydrogenase (NAD(P)+)
VSNVGIIGAGAWGTALAQMLSSGGHDVLLWALEPELAGEINARHTNSLFLPSAALAPTIRATSRLADAAECEVLLLVTPAQHLAATMSRMAAFPRDLVLCAKGIEAGTGRTMHEVAREAAPGSDIACAVGSRHSRTKLLPACRPR